MNEWFAVCGQYVPITCGVIGFLVGLIIMGVIWWSTRL